MSHTCASACYADVVFINIPFFPRGPCGRWPAAHLVLRRGASKVRTSRGFAILHRCVVGRMRAVLAMSARPTPRIGRRPVAPFTTPVFARDGCLSSPLLPVLCRHVFCPIVSSDRPRASRLKAVACGAVAEGYRPTRIVHCLSRRNDRSTAQFLVCRFVHRLPGFSAFHDIRRCCRHIGRRNDRYR